jgi:hypothetical protein
LKKKKKKKEKDMQSKVEIAHYESFNRDNHEQESHEMGEKEVQVNCGIKCGSHKSNDGFEIRCVGYIFISFLILLRYQF